MRAFRRVFRPARPRRALWLTVVGVVVVGLMVPTAVWASHRFTDVPTSNVFHNDITWLADTGVTLGCNPPANDEFCPNDAVTRAQMSAFLHRLAVNRVVDAASVEGLDAASLLDKDTYDPDDDGTVTSAANSEQLDGKSATDFWQRTDAVDADTLDGLDSTAFLGASAKAADADLLDGLDSTAFLGASAKAADADLLDGLDSSAFLGAGDTAVDADRLDGRHANELIRVAFAETAIPIMVPNMLTTTIEAPVDGFLLMSASADVLGGPDPGPFLVNCSLILNAFPLPASLRHLDMGTSIPDNEEVCATDAVAPVPVGVHTVDFLVDLGAGATTFGPATLWVLYVPFDGLGA